MMELVRLCVNVNAKRDSQQLLTSSGSGKEMFSSQRKERIFIDFDLNYFWQWTDFQSYVEAVASFLAGGSLLMYFMLKVEPFVEMVGFAAVFTEALLGTPQFYRNFKNKVMSFIWGRGGIEKNSHQNNEFLTHYHTLNISVNTWNEFTNGLHVDMWRSFQNKLFLFTSGACTILPLWLSSGNGGFVHITPSMALPRGYHKKKKGRSQYALLICVICCYLLIVYH